MSKEYIEDTPDFHGLVTTDPTRLLGFRFRDVLTGFIGAAETVAIDISGAVRLRLIRANEHDGIIEHWVNACTLVAINDTPGLTPLPVQPLRIPF